MPRERDQPGPRPWRHHPALGLLLAALFFCAGCASPGPPKPPSLQLPELVRDISAERSGDQVLLRWTTPSRTTDDIEIRGTTTAQVCRETVAQSAPPAARLDACTPIRRISVVPGASELADTLPPSLLADPVRLVLYRVQLFNAAGRSAGNSAVAAYAAAGQAPAEISRLRVRAAEQGAVLEWKTASPSPDSRSISRPDVIDIKRVDLSAPPSSKKEVDPSAATPSATNFAKGKSARPKRAAEEMLNLVHLRAADAGAGPMTDTAGTIDTTATMGDTYSYTAQRIRPVTIGSRQLEIASAPSPAVTVAMKDTFPPQPPAGLETISGTLAAKGAGALPQPYVDLSWEPNTEPDLAGYRVYRQLARPDGSPQGPLARLTALPIAVPALRDVAVKPGQGYIYSVTAVDAAGNESAPSAKALEFVSEAESGSVPDVEKPPH